MRANSSSTRSSRLPHHASGSASYLCPERGLTRYPPRRLPNERLGPRYEAPEERMDCQRGCNLCRLPTRFGHHKTGFDSQLTAGLHIAIAKLLRHLWCVRSKSDLPGKADRSCTHAQEPNPMTDLERKDL